MLSSCHIGVAAAVVMPCMALWVLSLCCGSVVVMVVTQCMGCSCRLCAVWVSQLPFLHGVWCHSHGHCAAWVSRSPSLHRVGVAAAIFAQCVVSQSVSPSDRGVASIPSRVCYSHASLVGTAKDLSSQTTKSRYHVMSQVIWITCEIM
jgi:hypothetical protein